MSALQAHPSSTVLTPQLVRLLPYYLLVLGALLAYGNIYDNAALYDDENLISKNLYLRDWHSLGPIFTHYLTAGAHQRGFFYRPLQNALYLIVYQADDGDLFGFHLLNVLLHAANGCLVYTLGRRLHFNPLTTFLAALIWALHPIHTEAVTYMSGTADMLYTFFCLSGVIILFPDFTSRRFYAAASFMILGLASKETAIIFPLLTMSCLYFAKPDRLNPKIYVRTWPLWLVAALYAALRLWIAHESHMSLLNIDPVSIDYATHFYLRAYTFFATLPAYLKLLLWPSGLHLDREFPVYLDPFFYDVAGGVALVVAAIAQILWGRGRRGLPLSWGLLWFAAAFIPHSGLLVSVNSLFLEHWMYMPSIGLVLGGAQTAAQTIHPRTLLRITAITAAAVAMTLGVSTFRHNTIWHDPFVFYPNIISHGAMSIRAHNNLGVAYLDSGDFNRALEQFKAALDVSDLTPAIHENIASSLSQMPNQGPQQIQQEIAELKRAIDIDPNFEPAYKGLADIYSYLGDHPQAAYYRHIDETLRRTYGQQ
jgi:tetratricopeptide (TPR) repeat protein